MNVLFVDAPNAGHAASAMRWRPSVFVDGNQRIQADHRRSMLFARRVPAIFMVASGALAGIALVRAEAAHPGINELGGCSDCACTASAQVYDAAY